MQIYLTHCSGKKFKTSGEVTPDYLYASRRTQAFMCRCKAKKVGWAIFSDLYGIWFPTKRHKWYDKAPSTVTPEEFLKLKDDFDRNLKRYDRIIFYYHPARFHSLYKKLLRESALKKRIVMIRSVKLIHEDEAHAK